MIRNISNILYHGIVSGKGCVGVKLFANSIMSGSQEVGGESQELGVGVACLFLEECK